MYNGYTHRGITSILKEASPSERRRVPLYEKGTLERRHQGRPLKIHVRLAPPATFHSRHVPMTPPPLPVFFYTFFCFIGYLPFFDIPDLPSSVLIMATGR